MGPERKRSKYEKERDRKRNNQRSEVEGKFGEAKERYGMKELYTRLPQTTKAEISLIFLAMNLVHYAREVANRHFEPDLITCDALQHPIIDILGSYLNAIVWMLCAEPKTATQVAVQGNRKVQICTRLTK